MHIICHASKNFVVTLRSLNHTVTFRDVVCVCVCVGAHTEGRCVARHGVLIKIALALGAGTRQKENASRICRHASPGRPPLTLYILEALHAHKRTLSTAINQIDLFETLTGDRIRTAYEMYLVRTKIADATFAFRQQPNTAVG